MEPKTNIAKYAEDVFRRSRELDAAVRRLPAFAARSSLFQAVCLALGIYAIGFIGLLRVPFEPQRKAYTYDTITVTVDLSDEETTRGDARTASSPPGAAEGSDQGKEQTTLPLSEEGTNYTDSGTEAPVKKSRTKTQYQSSGKDAVFSPGTKPRAGATGRLQMASKSPVDEKQRKPETRFDKTEDKIELPVPLIEAEEPSDVSDGEIRESRQTPGEDVPIELSPDYLIDTVPSVLSMDPPEFPKEYRGRIVRTETVIQVLVGSDGRVLNLEILRSGGRVFDEAAVRVVLSARFSPARVGGRSVACLVEISFPFESVRASAEGGGGE